MAGLLLDGLSTFVTGGASGIGRATALAFAEEGARVAVADLDAAGAEETAVMIRERGGESFSAALDVVDAAAVDTLVDAVVERWGGLDCAFNNAGVSREDLSTPWGDKALADLTFDVNARGVLHCMVAELRHMAKSGRGAIVNTASVAGLGGIGGAGYCGSKHAVIGFTRSAAVAYAAQGVRVNAVCPGVIATPMTQGVIDDPNTAPFLRDMAPMPRFGQAREIADAVVFLVSDKASFITGHPLAVDGGCMAR
jgi:NAD(P)-dependent dehydrogenase (short-subunit alcohol dehydrogenase family)